MSPRDQSGDIENTTHIMIIMIIIIIIKEGTIILWQNGLSTRADQPNFIDCLFYKHHPHHKKILKISSPTPLNQEKRSEATKAKKSWSVRCSTTIGTQQTATGHSNPIVMQHTDNREYAHPKRATQKSLE